MAKKKQPARKATRGVQRKPVDLTTDAGRIGDRIRQARERAGLSVLEAAERCGVSKVAWWEMERGQNVGWLLKCATIEKLFGIRIAE